jgi:beta-galactosidase
MKLKHFNVDDNQVTADFEMPEVKGVLSMTYTLMADGSVIVRQKLKRLDAETKVSDMFRFGMQLQMPGEYDEVEYYGRGPVENYIDRNSSEFIGVYNNKVADEYYPYVRPQESGNHTDVRWFRVKNKQGRGLEFYSNAPMEASALNYLTEDLDDGPVKDKKIGRHSGDLIPRQQTQVHIQQRQYGLGCVNSWGAIPRPEYRLPYKDYDFTFVVRPIK